MKLNKGFSLGELLVCIGLIGIIAAILIPQALVHKPSKSKALFRKAYNLTEKAVFDLINNQELFPEMDVDQYNEGADLSTGFAYFNPEKNREMNDTGKYFCKKFTEKMNTAGKVICDERHAMPDDGNPMENTKPVENQAATPNFVTNDGVAWFYSPLRLCSLDEDGVSRPEGTTCESKSDSTEGLVPALPPSTHNNYVCFQIDTNGNELPNSRAGKDPDRFFFCVYFDGKVAVPKETGAGKEVEYLRSNSIFNK